MSTDPKRIHLIRADDRAQMKEESASHPLNPNSLIHGVSLSETCGLQRLGIHWLRIPPGKESFVYHRHLGEEEFLFILSGRGVAIIDGEEHEVGPGDFMAFPTPSVGHHLRNPFSEDLVYLSGGERHRTEVAEYPQLGKWMVRVGMATSIFDGAAAEAYPGLPVLDSVK
jgi:uncharacterized cupin superfamily protein